MPTSPHIIRHNGGASPSFHSTVSIQKLRRLNTLILVLRLASFCFSLASAVFMATARSDSVSWTNFEAFRFVLAANAIVAVYSFAEMWFAVWEILKGETLFAKAVQVWFDFGHDQGFAYLLLSANAAGTALARTMNGGETCTASNAFCVQTYISVSLGFGAFLFLLFCALFSGFRVASFVINGPHFHL